MSRNRNIKPEFCKSQTLNRISLESNLLFIMLWMHCDDFGTILNSNRYILGQCFPIRESVSEKDINKWKNELIKEKLIVEVSYNGQDILIMRSWEEHQKVPNPSVRNNIDMNMKPDEIKAKIQELISEKLDPNETVISDKLDSNSPMFKSMSMNKSKSMSMKEPPKQVLPTASDVKELYIETAKEIFRESKVTLNLFKCSEKADEFIEYWIGDSEFPGEWIRNKKFTKQRINILKTIKNNIELCKDGHKFNFDYMANYNKPFFDEQAKKESTAVFDEMLRKIREKGEQNGTT